MMMSRIVRLYAAYLALTAAAVPRVLRHLVQDNAFSAGAARPCHRVWGRLGQLLRNEAKHLIHIVVGLGRRLHEGQPVLLRVHPRLLQRRKNRTGGATRPDRQIKIGEKRVGQQWIASL